MSRSRAGGWRVALFFQVNDVGHLSKVSLLLSVLRSLQLSQWSSARGGSNLPGHYCTDCTAAVHSFAFFGGSCGRWMASLWRLQKLSKALRVQRFLEILRFNITTYIIDPHIASRSKTLVNFYTKFSYSDQD